MTDKIRNIILIILFIIGILAVILIATLVEILADIGAVIIIFSGFAAFFVLHWDWFSKKK